MAGIDETREFHPLRIAIMTMSDTRTPETDTSGGLLVERLTTAGHILAGRAIVPDDIDAIRAQAKAWIADPDVDLIITTGGTGFMPRDVTPEAIRPLFRREMDGFSVVFHQASMGTIGVSTLQSRAFAGQAEDTFIFCVPGSTGACRDAWDLVLGFELDSRFRPLLARGDDPKAAGQGPVTGLTHLDAQGRATMVDVSDKSPTARTATAIGHLRCKAETVALVRDGKAPKGAVISTAELAGIMAAKRTADLIPLCHPLPLTKVAVSISIDDTLPGFRINAEVRTQGVTGVEMEALTAVSVAGLTLFDMLKAVDRSMEISGISVTSKSGGKSGSWDAA